MGPSTGADPWLIVGLGNPGPSYAGTRHNIGFHVVDLLAARAGEKFKANKSRGGLADVAEGRLNATRVVLTKPKTFVNLSGGPTAALRDFFKVALDRVIVVHDELDIDFAALRLKRGGGDNGHNGLRSITASLGSNDYFRVRFGVGRPPGRQDPADFVLKDFSSAERKELPFLIDRAADAVEALLTGPLEAAQNTFHPATN